MHSWASFTPAEQTLLRRAMSDSWLAGTVQAYGVDLRWAAADGAPPPRSYTEHEQRTLVPMLAAVTTDLVDRGLLTVRKSAGLAPSVSNITAEGSRLRAVLAKAENWLWSSDTGSQFRLSAPRFVHEHESQVGGVSSATLAPSTKAHPATHCEVPGPASPP